MIPKISGLAAGCSYRFIVIELPTLPTRGNFEQNFDILLV